MLNLSKTKKEKDTGKYKKKMKRMLYTSKRKTNMMSDHLMSCLENWCVDENCTR